MNGWRLTVGSLYLPKGGRADDTPAELARYRRKLRFLRSFRPYLTRARLRARADDREFLVMGDFNIAHTRWDLRNWRTSQKAVGLLPEEREWFASVLGPRTLADVVRRLLPETDGPYSWWSWMGNAFNNDVGWRIDYHLATPGLAAAATSGGTDRADSYETRMSDHAPVVVDYADGPASWHFCSSAWG
ncbi:MAG: exodeoxyribonuclease III [Umezawaea sp.]